MSDPSPRLVAGTVVLAWLVALGVLLQSVWAGGFLRGFYGDDGAVAGALTWHELGANATFALLAVEGLLVVGTGLRRRRGQLVSGLALGVLLTATIGLGYIGGSSVAVHVPLGVASFGAAVVHALLASGVRPDRRADAGRGQAARPR